MTSEPTPVDPKPVVAPRSAKYRLALAALALGWERVWVRLWIPTLCLGLLLAVALTDDLSVLPEALHLAVVIAAFLAIGAFAWRKLRSFTFPTRDEARARLEAQSPVGHRPLTTVEDALPPGADPGQQLLWQLHQKRAREDLARLRVAPPAPGVATRDPWAARAVVVLLLFIAFMGGWSEISTRLMRTIVPSFGRVMGSSNVKLWVTPPPYTHRAPLYVELPAQPGTTPPRSLEIPEGSTALAIVLGAQAQEDVFLNIGETTSKLERLADASRRGETLLTPGKRLEFLQDKKVIAGWDVQWIKDAPPTIHFAGAPAGAQRWQLRIDYTAADDYGVLEVAAHMSLPPGSPPLEDAPADFQLAVPPFAPTTVSQTTMNDLASHPWAGMTVELELTATDTAGLTGKSEKITTVLPEREFTHPIARELAKHRKNLLTDTKSAIAGVAALASVNEILKKPEAFNNDALAHLAISAAKFRLANESRAVSNLSVPGLLWHAAVRIEDGNLTVAEQKMRAAQKNLREALRRGAKQEELNELAKTLKDALSDFAKAQNEGNQKNSSFSAAMNQAAESAAKAIDQLRDKSENGSPEEMKKAFEDLEMQLMQLDQQQQRTQMTEDSAQTIKQVQQMMDRMQSMAEKQSKLLNDTFDQARAQESRELMAQQEMSKHTPEENKKLEGQRQRADKMNGDKAATQQDELRKELAKLMDDLSGMTGKTEKPLQDANKSMTEARDLLRKPALQEGSEAQGEALSRVQEGIQDATEEMMQMLQNKGLGDVVEMAGAPRAQFTTGQRTGKAYNGDVNLPTGPDPEGVASCVRNILEEIRQRAGDRTRSSEEQDYLHRLMKKF